MTARILVTGSRSWTDENTIAWALGQAAGRLASQGHDLRTTVLVSGACPRGADAIAERIWETYLLPVERHPADWDGPAGRGAGFARNAEMVALGADLCLAFPLGDSPGTRHTMRLAHARGIPVVNYDPDRMGAPA